MRSFPILFVSLVFLRACCPRSPSLLLTRLPLPLPACSPPSPIRCAHGDCFSSWLPPPPFQRVYPFSVWTCDDVARAYPGLPYPRLCPPAVSSLRFLVSCWRFLAGWSLELCVLKLRSKRCSDFVRELN